jgi:hypothetical protein
VAAARPGEENAPQSQHHRSAHDRPSECVLHDLPRDRSGTRASAKADRRAGPPVIVAALLLDVVFLAAALGPAAKWVIPTLVVSRRDAKT